MFVISMKKVRGAQHPSRSLDFTCDSQPFHRLCVRVSVWVRVCCTCLQGEGMVVIASPSFECCAKSASVPFVTMHQFPFYESVLHRRAVPRYALLKKKRKKKVKKEEDTGPILWRLGNVSLRYCSLNGFLWQNLLHIGRRYN